MGSPVSAAHELQRDSCTNATSSGSCAIVDAGVTCQHCTVPPACPSFAVPTRLGITSSGPIHWGQAWTVTLRGDPGEPAMLFGSNALVPSAQPELRAPF